LKIVFPNGPARAVGRLEKRFVSGVLELQGESGAGHAARAAPDQAR